MKSTVFVVFDETGIYGVTEIKADAQEYLNNYLQENELELISWEEGDKWTEHYLVNPMGHESTITIEEVELNEPF